MKAFTVYQPYAHAIVAGVKHYETRPRRTHIRGRVAVHAGRLDEVQATKHLTNGEFWAVLEAAGGGGNLPRGAVIGTVEIVDCVPVEELVDSLDMSVCVRVWKPILRRDRWAGMSISQNPRRR